MEDRRHIAVMPACRSNSEGGFTDIVGYTALMGRDENKAYDRLSICDLRIAMRDFLIFFDLENKYLWKIVD